MIEAYSHYLPNFLFILLRAGIVLMMLPIFNSTNFPASFRIGLAVAMAFVLTPVVNFSFSREAIPVVVVREVMFGMIFGFAARFIFFAVDVAGQMIAAVSGMSIAQIFNPEMGQSTEVSQLYGIITILLFLATDAHHDLIVMFVRSYEWLPLGTVSAQGIMAAGLGFASKMLVIGLKISAPVIITMLVTNLLLGFVAKAAPQMNVFFVGQPLNLYLGLLMMMLSLPVCVYLLGGYFKSIPEEMQRVLLLMKQ